jgi:phosphatidylinositol alpha-1,6-mannosyltransferase
LIERKGHDKVIESLPLVLSQFPDAVYLIVGDGPERSRLENLCDLLGLQNSVRFTGAVSNTDLLAFYKLATLFAMISRQPPNSHEVEGFGIVYLEANVSGLPVVAGRSGGVPDAVVEGETGYLVDPFSPEAIASAIIRLLQNPQLCAQLANYGRERAIKEFSWEQASDRLQKLTAEVYLETPKRSLLSTAIHTLPLIWQRSLFD